MSEDLFRGCRRQEWLDVIRTRHQANALGQGAVLGHLFVGIGDATEVQEFCPGGVADPLVHRTFRRELAQAVVLYETGFEGNPLFSVEDLTRIMRAIEEIGRASCRER